MPIYLNKFKYEHFEVYNQWDYRQKPKEKTIRIFAWRKRDIEPQIQKYEPSSFFLNLDQEEEKKS